MEFRYSRECLDVPDPPGFLLDSGRLVSSGVPGGRSSRDPVVTSVSSSVLHVL